MILLLDTGGKFFTVRNLIVGLSRAPLGTGVRIPPPGAEEIWIAGMPHVAEEVDKKAEPEVFQPEIVEDFAGLLAPFQRFKAFLTKLFTL